MIWPFKRKKRNQRNYDGASPGRRWDVWQKMASTRDVMDAARWPIAQRARYLVANNALAASAVEGWVAALVGTGIKPQSQHQNEVTRAKLNVKFEEWTDIADADNLTDFYGLQALMVRRMIIDGESFAILRVTENGLQVRVIDAQQVDASYNSDNILSGIEFDKDQRRIAYHVFDSIDGINRKRVRVPAEDVIHLFRQSEPGQVRGISWFSPVMLRLSDLDAWRDAQLVRQKVAAMLAGFVVSPGGDGQPFDGEDDGVGNLVGGLEPGLIKFLDPGQDVKFSTPANIGAEVIDFAKITEREIAVGLGLPASVLTGDLSEVNYSSIRAGLVEWRRRIEVIQHSIIAHQVCRPIWKRFATLHVLSGYINGTIDSATYANWIMPKQSWVDPKKDVEADIAAVDAGFISRREVVTSRGIDIEKLDTEIANDNKRAESLQLPFASKNQ